MRRRRRVIRYEVNRFRRGCISVGCTYIHKRIPRTVLRAIIHEDAFEPEENGRTGSRPLGLSGLSLDGKPEDEITTPFAFLPAVALLMLSETQGFPWRMSLFGRISAACSESHFRRNGTSVRKLARGSRSSGNLTMSYICGNTLALLVSVWYVVKIYLDEISLDTIPIVKVASLFMRASLQLAFAIRLCKPLSFFYIIKVIISPLIQFNCIAFQKL